MSQDASILTGTQLSAGFCLALEVPPAETGGFALFLGHLRLAGVDVGELMDVKQVCGRSVCKPAKHCGLRSALVFHCIADIGF